VAFQTGTSKILHPLMHTNFKNTFLLQVSLVKTGSKKKPSKPAAGKYRCFGKVDV